MKKIIILCACVFLLYGFMQKKNARDYVPNEETAIKIAEAIWLPIYGDKIYDKKPFKAILINDSIWKVEGTLNTTKGGVPYIEFRKSDCQVLKVTHTK